MPIRRFTHVGPFELNRTVRAVTAKAVGRLPGGPGEVWWPTTTPDGPAMLHLVTQRGSTVAEAWGAGADWALEVSATLIGANDDPASFVPAPGLVADLHRRAPGLRLGHTMRVFDSLVPAILGQRVTSVGAKRSYRSIVRTYGRPAPGPAGAAAPVAWIPPEPEVIASLGYADLHRHGVERSRALVLIETARRARRLEEAVDMPLADAYRRLQAVRGIGPWTAALVAAAALGDPDAVPVGDYHLPNLVSWALAGEPRGTDERMLELLEPYAGQRRRVLVLLKGSGMSAPRYGPKSVVRDIRSQ